MLVRDLDFVRSRGKNLWVAVARKLLGAFSVGGKPMFGRGNFLGKISSGPEIFHNIKGIGL